MKKLNILLWVSSLLLLIACEHKSEQEDTSEQTLKLSFSKASFYEGDTTYFQVFVNGQPYSGKLILNDINIYWEDYNYPFIIPNIQSDSTPFLLTAQLGTQTASQIIQISKRAFKYPLVSYQNTIQPLLTSNCNFSGCHANGSRAGKVELSCYDSTMKSVAPYNSNASLLYIALVKTDPLRVMPPAGRLHNYKIEDVRVWIEQGAQNN